jgi:lipopolysaccharide transport system ATP-binding protein
MDDDAAICFDAVTKWYPSYHSVTGGIKTVLFDFAETLRSLRRRHLAIDAVSFSVRRGEFFGVFGRNGAGKSTILGMIAGVLSPSVGRITVRGRVTPLLQLGAGFHPDLTGRANILLNGMLLGMTRRQVMAAEADIIAFADIDDFIDEPIRTYSSGMLSRLGFAVAAHSDPEILLMDEILAVGDVGFKVKCHQRIKEMRQRGVTIVLVSHSPSELVEYCDRVILVDNHRIKCEGAPAEVLREYLKVGEAARVSAE